VTTEGRALMIQGTASSAGKSFLVAGLCRLFAQEGLRVAPFKSQNMSNNAYVTIDGHEIGRAQAVQAQAARVIPNVDMNPVLLKPESDRRSQVIVMGRPLATLNAAAYQEVKERIWDDVVAALARLRAANDLVIIEGAGSPAEINLKSRDIANMRVALHADAPVLIAGDIDRGGVFAHLYGTHALLDPQEKALVRGFVINKLRGDPALLEPGLTDIEALTGVPVVGVVPWVLDHRLPEEDSVALDWRNEPAGSFDGLDVAVIRLPRIANFDDFDPLEAEPDVRVRYVAGEDQFGNPDLLILPGTKATIADLAWLRSHGLDGAILRAREAGAAVIGICGGFQMLGTIIEDLHAVESTVPSAEGLGLLAARTAFGRGKQVRQSTVTVTAGHGVLKGTVALRLDGYEIHAGETAVEGDPAAVLADGTPLALLDSEGWTLGCYLHGLFHSAAFRRTLLANVAARRAKAYRPAEQVDADAAFDRVADVLRSSLDLARLYPLAGLPPP
jgi:adenosylcobyric acid synthase